MQGHRHPHPMMHRLHNASPQECAGNTVNVKHVTWGGVQVRHIHMHEMDNQRIGKISEENLWGRFGWEREIGHMQQKKHITRNV